MSLRTIYGTGLYQANEASLLIYDSGTPFNGTRKAVIALHGRSANATVFMPGSSGNTFSIGTHAAAIAKAGYIVASIDAGGTTTWGNANALTAISNAYTWLVNTVGAFDGKVGLLGWSMGGLAALNWAKNNSSLAGCCCLFAPVTDLDYFHDNPTYTSEIDTAYGNNYNTNSVGYKGIDDASFFTTANIPMRLLHGTSDTTVPDSQTTAYVNAVNNPIVVEQKFTGAGHTDLFGHLSVDETARYFKANLV